MERQTGETPADLIGPPLPAELDGVWHDFLDVCGRRGATTVGPAPLTYQDLDAWARLTGITPEPWRIRLLLQLDTVFLDVIGPKPPPKAR